MILLLSTEIPLETMMSFDSLDLVILSFQELV